MTMSRGAAYDYKKTNLKTNYYVNGSTVRRLEGEPEERRRRQLEKEREIKKKQHRYAAKRNRERASHISPGYVLFCTMAMLITCGVCVAYIQIQSDITGRMKHISRLESQVADLRADNDAAMKRIDLSTDLDAVKKKALEIGMKYAAAEQIVYYSIEDDDYMNQYADIPQR